jgi:hypothetical protein
MSSTQTTGTNGYQIRLEVLKMAKEMAEQDFYSQRDILKDHHQQSIDFARNKADRLGYDSVEFPKEPSLPSFPTPDLIKTKAGELYSFITTK